VTYRNNNNFFIGEEKSLENLKILDSAIKEDFNDNEIFED